MMSASGFLRYIVWTSYLLQAAAALVGGLCLYVAIDTFLRGAFILSALNTAIAFFNSESFIEQARWRANARAVLRQMRERQ